MLLKPELTRSKTTQRHPQCNAHTRAVVSRTYSGLLKRTLASQVKSILRGFQRTWAKRTELGTPRVLVGHSRISSHSQHHPAGFYCPSGRKTEPPLNGGDGGPFTAGGGEANRKSQASSLAGERNGAGSASQAAPTPSFPPGRLPPSQRRFRLRWGSGGRLHAQPWSRFRLRHRSSARPLLTSAKPPQVRPKRTRPGPETSRWPPDGSSARSAIALCPLAAA